MPALFRTAAVLLLMPALILQAVCLFRKLLRVEMLRLQALRAVLRLPITETEAA